MRKPCLLKPDQLPAPCKRLIISAIGDMSCKVKADRKRFRVADNVSKFRQPLFVLRAHLLWRGRVEIHHHNRQIDALGRGVGVFGLHDVVFAQNPGFVFDHKARPAIAIDDHRTVNCRPFAGP